MGALMALVAQLDEVMRRQQVQSAVAMTLLQAIGRIVPTQFGFGAFITLDHAADVLHRAIRSEDPGVVYWGLEVLCVLTKQSGETRDEAQELENKTVLLTDTLLVGLGALMDEHGSKARHTHGALVTMSLVVLLESVLCSSRDTTPGNVLHTLLELVGSRHAALLQFLRSSCPAVTESAALIMRTVVEDSPAATAALVKNAALTTGVSLQHFREAIFAPTGDQRFVSRYLVGLWMSSHEPSMSLLQRMVPAGLIHYLTMPGISGREAENMEAVELAEAEHKESGGLAETGRRIARQGPAWRLRLRLKTAQSRGVGLANGVRDASMGRRSGDGPAMAGPMTAGTARMVRESQNFVVFFHMATQDHSLPDLIWDQATRGELRDYLDAELREYQREQDAANNALQDVSWNHLEFEVDYPSLNREVRIGDHYVRLLLDSGAASVQQLREPSRFFELLYRRFLWEPDKALQALCLRAMTSVYEVHQHDIGLFEDTPHVALLLARTRHLAIRDRLLLLLQALARNNENAELLLRVRDRRMLRRRRQEGGAGGCGELAGFSLRLLVSIASMAHTQLDVRTTNAIQSALLLTAGESAAAAPMLKAGDEDETKDATPATAAAASAAPKESNAGGVKWSAEAKRMAADRDKAILSCKFVGMGPSVCVCVCVCVYEGVKEAEGENESV